MAHPVDGPNIIFIMADDMGYGDVGCFNHESRIPTPHMDRLAAEGLRCRDAHSPSAVCTPSRYGVLTGRYCWRTRLKEGVTGGYAAPLIDASRLTVASMLKQRGYATACIGKWHVGLGFRDKAGRPTEREEQIDFGKPIAGGPAALGFDYAYYHAGCGTCAPPYGFIEHDRFVDEAFSYYDSDQPDVQSSGMMGESWITRDADVVIAQKACEYIEARAGHGAPFFLYLAPNAPHEPCTEALVPEFACGRSEAGARGDLVWLFDWVVGEVTRTLEKTGQTGNTLLVVTSDNGALPGEFVRGPQGCRVDAGTGKREFLYRDYGHASCGDYRGYKAHIWEGGHRVPFMARWPGKISAGRVSDEPVCLTDVMATCAAITAYDLPEDAAEDSYSILPVLTGGESVGPAVGSTIREATIHHSSFGVFSVRQGRWKLILDTKTSGGWPTPRGAHPQPGTPGQLYDMVADAAEETDLWAQEPAVVAQLTGLLEAYTRTGRSAPIDRTC